MENLPRFVSGLIFLLLVLSGCANMPGGDGLPQQTVDGLERVKSSRLDVAYLRPGVNLGDYKKVMIRSVEVRFQKNWEREHREISQKEQQRIKTGLTELFDEVFRDELQEKGGIPVVQEAGPEVLELRAQLNDLYINAPDDKSAGRKTVYVESAGSVVLTGELYDSVTGQILARVVDRKEGRNPGARFEVSSRISNSREARIALRYWAGLLRESMTAIKDGQ